MSSFRKDRRNTSVARIQGWLQALALSCLFLSASCGTFFGDSNNSDGVGSLSDEMTAVGFNGSVSDIVFKSFPFVNAHSQSVTITQVQFENNLCASFSLYAITDELGAVLSQGQTNLHLSVKAKETVNLTVRFSPTACIHKDYDTLLKVYYEDNNGQTYSITAARLKSQGSIDGGGGNNGQCEEAPADATYETVFTSSIPADGSYYIQVISMRAFILPLQAPQQAVVFGTDIGEVDPQIFARQTPYLSSTISKTNKTITLNPITTCDKFVIPSAQSDPYFNGADTVLSSKMTTSGTMNRDEATRITDINLSGLDVQLRAEGIGKESLIPDKATGTFQISLTVETLTTGKIAPEAALGDTLQKNAQFKKGIFNLVDEGAGKFSLEGRPLVNGAMILVGKGKFHNHDNNFIGDRDTAKNFLIDNDAFIFIQLEAVLTKREGAPL